MAAIGAIFERDGTPVSANHIERMAAALQIYGPLSQNHCRLGNVGLCWNKLADFIPEDRYDREPIVEGSMAFVFSGRLHFRKDLARAVGLEAARIRTMADGEIAFAAWRKWGKTALDRLEGEFALIFSNEATGKLIAARSPFGAPPLVYHETNRSFAIASAPRGLFALPHVPRELDEQRMADMLILNNQDKSRTFYKQIQNLPMGHWLEISRHAIEVQQYFYFGQVEPVRLANDDEYVEAADALMRDAVEDAMRGIVTPAFTISAGLDSSTVAVYAIEALKRGSITTAEPLIGFTTVPEPGWDGRTYGAGRIGDESGPVKAFVQKYPEFSVEFIDGAGLALDHELDTMFRLAESPPHAWNNNYGGIAINKRVRANGRNIQIGGGGGNRSLSFSNRMNYPNLFVRGRWGELHGHLAKLNDSQGLLKSYYRRVFRPLLPASISRKINRLRGNLNQTGWASFSAIHPDFAAEMNVDSRAKEMGWDDSYSSFRSSRQLMKHMTNSGARELGASERLAMQTLYGMEGRNPLNYQRISEYCSAIPEQQFMSKGRDRWLIRRLMKDRLPEEILTAPRGRQAADWHLRMTRDLDRYRQDIDRMAADPNLARMFDVPRIRKILDSWPDKTPLGKADHPDYMLAMVGIGRAITASRFINWVNGKND